MIGKEGISIWYEYYDRAYKLVWECIALCTMGGCLDLLVIYTPRWASHASVPVHAQLYITFG